MCSLNHELLNDGVILAKNMRLFFQSVFILVEREMCWGLGERPAWLTVETVTTTWILRMNEILSF